MKYQRLKNLVVLVTAARTSRDLPGAEDETPHPLREAADHLQRFFGIPPFRFYALADGIKNILSKAAQATGRALPNLQLELLLAWDGSKSEETPKQYSLTSAGLLMEATEAFRRAQGLKPRLSFDFRHG